MQHTEGRMQADRLGVAAEETLLFAYNDWSGVDAAERGTRA